MQTKIQKEIIISELTEKLKDAKAAVFADFKGLTMKDMVVLRKELRAEGISFKVVKKTLLNIALKKAEIEADVLKMEGQIAIAVSPKDEVAAARILSKFYKLKENSKITGGILEGKLINVAEVIALSKLPSKEELLAKFVGTINAPVSNFVQVMAGNLSGFVRVLKAVAEKK